MSESKVASETSRVQAIIEGVEEMHRRHAARRRFDGHDLINWLDANRNAQLNDIYDAYGYCKDPEMTADQQIGKFLYNLGQVKIGERVSARRITRRGGGNRNGKCIVSIWEISKRTIDGLAKAKEAYLGSSQDDLGIDLPDFQ